MALVNVIIKSGRPQHEVRRKQNLHAVKRVIGKSYVLPKDLARCEDNLDQTRV